MLIEIGAGLLLSNFADWAIHKYVLHGWGKKKGSFFSFHWHDHHNRCRKNENIDRLNYQRSVFKDNPHAREFWSLGIGAGVASGILLSFGLPAMAYTVDCYAVIYYTLHNATHSIDPDFLPWHKKHHMGDQNKNWCVVFPLMDWLLGTAE